MSIPIQFYRTSTLGLRPDPEDLLEGQPAVNLNPEQPGLFFTDSEGSSLIKIGPPAIGEEPPTASPSLGEGWVQPDGDSPGIPILWIFDGTDWRGVTLTETYVEP